MVNKEKIEADVKLAIYLRVSSKQQAEKGEGLEGQLFACKKFIKEEFGINPNSVPIYKDEGLSADKYELEERKELWKLLKDVKRGRVNRIIIFKHDRAFRNDKDKSRILEMLQLGSCLMYDTSLKQEITKGNPQQQFMLDILTAISKYEIELARLRQLATKEQMFDAGKFRGGELPYGFEWEIDEDSEGREKLFIKPIEEESKVYLSCLHKFFNENKGSTIIARELNEGGVPYRTGEKNTINEGTKSWGKENVSDMLKNTYWFGAFSRNKITRYRDENGKRRVKRNPVREWEIKKSDIIKPVITEKIYWKIIEKIESNHNGNVAPRQMATSWLLTGLLKCKCGTVMRAKTSGDKRYSYYKCYNYNCNSEHKSYKKREIEKMVLHEFNKDLEEKLTNKKVETIAINNLTTDIDDLINNEQHLKEELNEQIRLREKCETDYLESKEDYEKKFIMQTSQKLDKKIEKIEKSISELNDKKELKRMEIENLANTLDGAKLFKNSLEISHEEDKDIIKMQRASLLMMVNSIQIQDGETIINYRDIEEEIPSYLSNRMDKEVLYAIEEIVEGESEVSATSDKINDLLVSLGDDIHESHHRYQQTDVLIKNLLSMLSTDESTIKKTV